MKMPDAGSLRSCLLLFALILRPCAAAEVSVWTVDINSVSVPDVRLLNRLSLVLSGCKPTVASPDYLAYPASLSGIPVPFLFFVFFLLARYSR